MAHLPAFRRDYWIALAPIPSYNLLIINMRYLMFLTFCTDFSLPYFMCKILYISQLLHEIREWKSLFYCCT